MNFLPTFLLFAATSAANFGDKCQHIQDCLKDEQLRTAGLMCKWASSSCGFGICTCDEGYQEDVTNRRCSRVAKLGEFCQAQVGDTCQASNSICLQSKCQCSDGFKVGLKGDDCVPEKMTPLKFGESCYYRVALFHDAFCAYNLVCTTSGCQCPPGFRVNPDGNFDCIPIKIGETCKTDVDCSRNPNSICSQQRNMTCSCRRNFHPTRVYIGDETTLRCVRINAVLLSEGDYCGDAYPYSTPFLSMNGICSQPLSCVSCYDTHSPSQICAVRRGDSTTNPAVVGNQRKQQIFLGDRCENMYASECSLPNTDCINGICQCIPGTSCVYRDYESSGDIYDTSRQHALVGAHCSGDSECSPDGSMFCKPVSQSCSRSTPYLQTQGGVCACSMPNYIERIYKTLGPYGQRLVMTTCARRLRLGEVCAKARTMGRAMCVAKNSDCIFGVCQCVQGFKMAPWGDECIPDEQIRFYGEQCLLSEECYFSQSFELPMACLDNTCGCLAGSRPGMLNPDGPAYGCIANRLGDRCMSDMDCHLYWRYNWHCSTHTQTCECNPGYYAARLFLRDGSDKSQAWCVPYNATLRPEGSTCKQNIQDMSIEGICANPLVCSTCQNVYGAEGICGWVASKAVEIPKQVTVLSWTKSRHDLIKSCSGVQIDSDSNILLVPTHCLSESTADELVINVVGKDSTGMNITLTTNWVLRHPLLDITLLKYEKGDQPFHVQTIQPPSHSFCRETYNCSIEEGDGESSAEIIPTRQCQYEYGVSRQNIRSMKTICAGRYPSSVSNKCVKNTSPSPLICSSPNGQRVVIGMPLQLNDCAVSGLPRVFTRICSDLDWINQARTVTSTLQFLGSSHSCKK